MKFPYKVIDLTQKISNKTPIWPGDPAINKRLHASIKDDKFLLNEWSLGEHTGTHTGAPSHLIPGGKTIDEYGMDELIYPLVIIHQSNQEKYSNISIDDLSRDEEISGIIEDNSIVVINTGWSKRWPYQDNVFETDIEGNFIYPGFTAEAVKWLISDRRVKGLGTDAPGIDPGDSRDFKSNKLIASHGGIHLENLDNLDKLPARGSWIVVGALPLEDGSGSPARIFALIPE